MRSFLVLLSLASGSLAGVLEKRDCNADNCARAVTGTRYAPSIQAQHTADCSSFLIQTITPATPTSTVTITGTSFSVIGSNSKRTPSPELDRYSLAGRDGSDDFLLLPPAVTARSPASPAEIAARQVTQNPSDVPIYASACSGAVRYSSACSCAGVTEATIYAPTPASATVTVYGAPSIIPVCDPNQNYGYSNLGGSIQSGAGFRLAAEGSLSPQECCAVCFQEGSSCFVYEYYQGVCFTAFEVSGSHTPTDYCPYGIYTISSPGSGSFYGLGPCAVFPDGRHGE